MTVARNALRVNERLVVLRDMALFIASPFIGLVYAVLLPFVGLGLLLWAATEGLRKPAPATEAAVQEHAAVLHTA